MNREEHARFSIRDRIRSVRYATHGIITMLQYEHNAWIHTLFTLIVVIAGVGFGLSRDEWCIIILTIGSVWMAEALNTALEFLADVAVPDIHPLVEKAKDVAAGAVLITCIGSVLVGLLILGPYFLAFFRR